MGGADLVTSKFALLGPPTRPDADVDYDFYQVDIEGTRIGRRMNCGNMSAAVGPFAIDEGWVGATGPETEVRFHNFNTRKIIHALVPTADGKARMTGDTRIDGVPRTGVAIRLDFRDGSGGATGKLLPTGEVKSKRHVPGVGKVEFSVVDIANLMLFVPVKVLGLERTEDPVSFKDDKALMGRVEKIRGAVSREIGLASSPEKASEESSDMPAVSIVSPPSSKGDFDSCKTRSAEECDLGGRIVLMGEIHKAYMATGSVCTGVAALLAGSVVHEACRPEAAGSGRAWIGHP